MVTLYRKRNKLGEVLPLDTPYTIQIFPVYACNFKCEFCIHAVPMEQRGFISDTIAMDYTLYQKAIDDIAQFPQRLKLLRFAAMGEPLLHPQIADMVQYAKEKDVAESIEIVTNGALLTHDLSIALIAAGLSRIRISIDGLCDEDYVQHCGRKIDFDQLVEQIRFFYRKRNSTLVYIKIIDYMLQDEDSQEKFYSIFGEISDQIAVEHLTPTISEINFSDFSDTSKLNLTQEGHHLRNSKICPMSYYFMQVNPDGNVVPCCNTKYPSILGSIKTDSLVQIWYSSTYRQFQRNMLDGVDSVNTCCSRCNLYLYGLHEEDTLDEYAKQLKPKYEAKECTK